MERTCQNDELSTVLVAKAVVAVPGKNVCRNLCDVAKRNRRKVLALSNRQWQDLLLPSRDRVQQEILCV
jgi:hypothetical protein